ncbi:MAG TPA: adenine phosphoribosyltransferase [Firmicutes bacterium]|nr:adenine phosphoribosyltransferase [Bacillota bacterium]
MAGTYTLEVAGLERELPLCPVNEKLDIAAFIMFSDVELTMACARELLKKCPEHDLIITAESKGIPLAYEMARQEGKRYLVARKSTKLYMSDPIAVNVKSITTARMQTLYLDRHEADSMKGKRILIADDVISTGESLRALCTLVQESGGIIAGQAAVLAEGDAADRKDIIYLEKLPLFFKDMVL